MSARHDSPSRRPKGRHRPVIFHVTEMALPPPPEYDLLGRRRGRPYLVNMLAELVLAGLAGAVSGAVIGFLAALLEAGSFQRPLVMVGAASGLLAGVIATVAGREVLPRLSGFSLPARVVMVLLTLVGGAIAATFFGFLVDPAFSVHAGRSVLLVGAMNGLLALVAGTLVFAYEDLHHRLVRANEILAATRLAQSQARERAARAELLALQARINPHFFFNALNTAAAFVRDDPRRAEDLLERFAELFRYAFRRGSDRAVPLEEELRFIGDFLEIERARFGDRVRAEVQAAPEVRSDPVPPLLLQPLVENAVLHGRDPETGEGRIFVRAYRGAAGALVLEVRDHGPGPGGAGQALPRGHALENIAARVAATRGGWLEIDRASDGPGTLARIVLPPAAADPAATEEEE
ncbi:MAG: histidine kinase [Acidobacteria bacterium]|nr:histidine kinase [Acidobacteriota bacterium]